MAEKETRLHRIVDSTIVKTCALLLFTAAVGFCGWMKRSFLSARVERFVVWAKDEHTIIEPGWRWMCWFSLPLLCCLFILFLWMRLKASSRYARKETILKILAEWAFRNQSELRKEILVRFCDIDTENNLKRGSARKYLKTIIDNHQGLRIDFIDNDTAFIGSQKEGC